MRDLPMNVADTPDSALAKLIGRKILAFDTETGRVAVSYTHLTLPTKRIG